MTISAMEKRVAGLGAGGERWSGIHEVGGLHCGRDIARSQGQPSGHPVEECSKPREGRCKGPMEAKCQACQRSSKEAIVARASEQRECREM